jgi:hypothetical protein
MTDPELIAKKLGEIETCVSDLRTLAQPDRLRQDIRERRFIEHTLQLAIQAALDVASHIVSDERMGEPAPIASSSIYSSAAAGSQRNWRGPFETWWGFETFSCTGTTLSIWLSLRTSCATVSATCWSLLP